MLLVLFLSIGVACATQNNESNIHVQENADVPLPVDDIDNAMKNCEDNGAIQLEKEYYLNESKTFKINKSITFNGHENGTEIEGNSNCLILDVFDKKPAVNDDKIIFISLDDGLKKTGKHLIFNNITFKNVKLQTWHDMKFNDCSFINSTFTSHEMDNRFDNCIFNNSIIEVDVVMGYGVNEIPRFLSEFSNCEFYQSELKTQTVYPPNYIYIVGGDFFRVLDGVNIKDCRFNKSKVSLNNILLNVIATQFNSTNLTGHSNIVNIKNSEFKKQSIDFLICKSNFTNSSFDESKINLQASYFSIGSLTDMANCSLNSSNIKISPGFRSRQSQINIRYTNMDNSYIDTTDANVAIQNSRLNDTEMMLCFSSLRIADSIISNNDSAQNTIKTKLQDTIEAWVDGKYANHTVYYQIKTDYSISNTYFINESGRFKLESKDISKNTLYEFTYIKQEVYFQNNALIFTLKDQNGNPVSGERIYVEIEERYVYDIPCITTDGNGTAKYYLSEAGNFNIHAFYYSPGFNFDNIMHSLNLHISIKPPVKDLKVSKHNFKENTYSSIKSYLKLKLTGKSNGDLSNVKVTIKFISKNKNKKYKVYSNSKGKIKFKIPKKLDAGKYKVEIKVPYTNITKTITLKIKKAKASVKAPKVTGKFKKSGDFKVTLKNKMSNKAISKVKVKIKVYTGKKYKTYTVKTNKKGIAKINTKNLKIGNHKVEISSANNNYKISKKSEIKIEK